MHQHLIGSGRDLIKQFAANVANAAAENRSDWVGSWGGGTKYYWEEDTSGQTMSAPTLIATAAADQQAGIQLDPHQNRLAVPINLADRTSWVFSLLGYNRDAGLWTYLRPSPVEAVAVALGTLDLQVTVTGNVVLPFELGGHFHRIALVHVSAAGGSGKARAYFVG